MPPFLYRFSMHLLYIHETSCQKTGGTRPDKCGDQIAFDLNIGYYMSNAVYGVKKIGKGV